MKCREDGDSTPVFPLPVRFKVSVVTSQSSEEVLCWISCQHKPQAALSRQRPLAVFSHCVDVLLRFGPPHNCHCYTGIHIDIQKSCSDKDLVKSNKWKAFFDFVQIHKVIVDAFPSAVDIWNTFQLTFLPICFLKLAISYWLSFTS